VSSELVSREEVVEGIEKEVERYVRSAVKHEVGRLAKRLRNVIDGVFNWYHIMTNVNIKTHVEYRVHDTGVELHVYDRNRP